MKYQVFWFEDYDLDEASGKVSLRYSLDGKVQFYEQYDLPVSAKTDYPAEVMDRVLFGLWVIAGISYYKTFIPPELKFRRSGLDEGQRAFFEKVYRLGLGEFAYINQVDPSALGRFEASLEMAPKAVLYQGEGSLIGIGGGKDSLVALDILSRVKAHQITTFVMKHTELLRPLLDRISRPHVALERTVDLPQLKAVAAEGALNGHVPFSAILGFASLMLAVWTGQRNVVVANEASSGEGNVAYRDIMVNHQYSKSLEYERDFREYTKRYISSDLQYFSIVRPLSELAIAEFFCTRLWRKYEGVFSSCNRSFVISRPGSLGWCGECAKCAFANLMFAPFVPKPELLALFGGRNLFEQPNLEVTYRELLGLTGHKPLDCVGETDECRQAVVLARRTGNYPELDRFEFDDPEIAYQQWREHDMPDWAEDALRNYTPSNS